ncbi:MAG: cation diffusion facilitator family transporter [candidate division WOR-3 bacterium]
MGVAFFVFFLKLFSYFITNSIALLTDSVETINNIIASGILFFSIKKSLKPPDEEHPYGHQKMEYISSLFEGFLILLMGFSLIYISFKRFFMPFELKRLDAGIMISGITGIINFLTSVYLYKKAKEIHSIAIKTDAKHLFSDSITTFCVILGLFIVLITNKKIIDPAIGIIFSGYIIFLGAKSIIETADEILDKRIEEEDIIKIKKVLFTYSSEFIEFHELRTRKSGDKKFVDLHLVFPPEKNLKDVHEICDEIEKKLKEKIKNIDIIIHPEPYEK